MKNNSIKKELEAIVTRRKLSAPLRTSAQESISKFLITNSESIKSPNFGEISSSDLGLLFHVTDEHFFEGKVARLCEQTANRPLSFRLSTRMTSTGGMTTMAEKKNRQNQRETEFEIAIATTPLFATFKDEPSAIVSGVKCLNRIQALQRVMEHEMIHLVEMLLWRDSNCQANQFKKIARRFFGHTESNHQLLTPKDVARKKLGIAEGDLVTFSMEGQRLTGHVNRITKRATILVKSPSGSMYDDGHKYNKYYVPLNRIKRA